MIIRNGFNVYPREVEEVLYTHPGGGRGRRLRRAGCRARRGDRRAGHPQGRRVGDRRGAARLRKDRIASYKYPRIIRFGDRCPKARPARSSSARSSSTEPGSAGGRFAAAGKRPSIGRVGVVTLARARNGHLEGRASSDARRSAGVGDQALCGPSRTVPPSTSMSPMVNTGTTLATDLHLGRMIMEVHRHDHLAALDQHPAVLVVGGRVTLSKLGSVKSGIGVPDLDQSGGQFQQLGMVGPLELRPVELGDRQRCSGPAGRARRWCPSPSRRTPPAAPSRTSSASSGSGWEVKKRHGRARRPTPRP